MHPYTNGDIVQAAADGDLTEHANEQCIVAPRISHTRRVTPLSTIYVVVVAIGALAANSKTDSRAKHSRGMRAGCSNGKRS